MRRDTDQIPVTRPESEPDRPLWARHLRREFQYLLDLVMLVAAFALAYLLRFDFRIPDNVLHGAAVQLPVVVLLQFITLLLTGIQSFVWRYVGMADILPFLRAAAYSLVPLLALRFGLPESMGQWRVPLSVVLMDMVFAYGGLLGIRVLRRALYERFERDRRRSAAGSGRRRPVLLAGAGRAGVMAVREIRGRGDMELDLVGFVDDDPSKQATTIGGLRVLGTTDDLPRLIAQHGVDHVVITLAAAGAETIRRIVEVCERAGIRARIIPGLYEILQGRVSIARIRDVEIEDLLGREPVRLDEDEVRRFLTGKTVMVTGAGGSIGSELARQIARFSPARLLLVERAEGALFEVDRELRQLWPQLPVEALVGDVGDRGRCRAIFDDWRPHVVVHAAAHKHVPMMESNPAEAVKNNVVATALLASLAGEAGVEAFILISTDKAVRPASVMGATKRMAELVIQTFDRRHPGSRFLAVRFGNVMGSAGSVVPIFREQIARGGPVTVTDPEVRRYFMTVSEAAQLVLEAGAIGSGGEIMTLDMGEPVKIVDLARDMIRLSGYRPFDEVPIVFTGLRPGEKLFEELELSEERFDRTQHPKIFVGRLSVRAEAEVDTALARLTEAAAAGAAETVRELLAELLPEARLTGAAAADPEPVDSDAGVVH